MAEIVDVRSKSDGQTNLEVGTDTGNDSETLTINLSQDVYSMVVLLIETDAFDQLSSCDRILMYILALFSAFMQISGAALLVMEGSQSGNFSQIQSNIKLYDNEDAIENQTPFYEGILDEESGINADFDFAALLIRLVAFGVLSSYLAQDLSSIIDYFMIIKSAKHKIHMSAMMFFQSSVTLLIMSQASSLIMNQPDVIDVLQVGVGLVILLEMDNYLYQAISTYTNYTNDDLFVYKIKMSDAWCGCRCGGNNKCKPFTVKLSFVVGFLIVMQVITGGLMVAFYNLWAKED